MPHVGPVLEGRRPYVKRQKNDRADAEAGNCPTACFTRFRSWKWPYKFLMELNTPRDPVETGHLYFSIPSKKGHFLFGFVDIDNDLSPNSHPVMSRVPV